MQAEIIDVAGSSRGGWQLPDAILQQLPRMLADICETGDPKEQIAAAKVLIEMMAQNQKNEQHDDNLRMDEGRTRLLALLGRDGPAKRPRLTQQQGEAIAGGGNSERATQPATKKRKSGKPQ